MDSAGLGFGKNKVSLSGKSRTKRRVTITDEVGRGGERGEEGNSSGYAM